MDNILDPDPAKGYGSFGSTVDPQHCMSIRLSGGGFPPSITVGRLTPNFFFKMVYSIFFILKVQNVSVTNPIWLSYSKGKNNFASFCKTAVMEP